eukprot:scaffold86223_cov62-Phaeocystis_antarctica.AAC.7
MVSSNPRSAAASSANFGGCPTFPSLPTLPSNQLLLHALPLRVSEKNCSDDCLRVPPPSRTTSQQADPPGCIFAQASAAHILRTKLVGSRSILSHFALVRPGVGFGPSAETAAAAAALVSGICAMGPPRGICASPPRRGGDAVLAPRSEESVSRAS